MNKSQSLTGAAFALCSAIGISTAQATAITFEANGTGADGALLASAAFTTGAGHLNLVLANLLPANVIRSAGQALSDITFTLSIPVGAPGTTTAAGQLGNVSGAGLVTYTSGSPTRFLGAGGQGLFFVFGNAVTLEAIGGGQPTEMILPAIGNGSTYTNVNQGFQNFDPYTIGPATFGLDLPGLTASTTILSTTFSFGTGPDSFVRGTPTGSNVPEPATLAIFGTALAGLSLIHRRRKKV
jgi:hypothetical protein